MQSFENAFVNIETRQSDMLKVIVRFTGKPTDQEMDDYLAHITKIYELNLPFLILYDGTDIGMLSMAQVYKQADFMRKKDEDTRRLIKKCAIVLTSTPARITLDTVFALKPPACKLQIFQDMETAKSFLRQKDF